MKANMGTPDRIIRVLVAIIVLVLYFTGVTSGTFGIVLIVIGAVLLSTSFINYCPLYGIFGVSTNRKK